MVLMITKHDLIDTFVGKKIVDALIETLYNQDPDFPETHRTYLSGSDTYSGSLLPASFLLLSTSGSLRLS